jgi:hypothetical protein
MHIEVLDKGMELGRLDDLKLISLLPPDGRCRLCQAQFPETHGFPY